MVKVSLITVALVSGFSLISSAASKPYISGKISYADVKVKNDFYDIENKEDTISGSLSYGISDKYTRTELEISYTSVDVKDELTISGINLKEKDTLSNTSFMLNTFFDIPTNTIIVPYVGIGAGLGINKYKVELSAYSNNNYAKGSASETKVKLAWQGLAGVMFDVSEHVSLDLGYKYVDYGEVEDTEATANVFQFGLKYNF